MINEDSYCTQRYYFYCSNKATIYYTPTLCYVLHQTLKVPLILKINVQILKRFFFFKCGTKTKRLNNLLKISELGKQYKASGLRWQIKTGCSQLLFQTLRVTEKKSIIMLENKKGYFQWTGDLSKIRSPETSLKERNCPQVECQKRWEWPKGRGYKEQEKTKIN